VAPPPAPPPHVAPPPPPVAPVAVPAPPPAPPPDLAKPSDQAARRLLAYHEQLLGKSPEDLLAEVARLDAQTAGAAASPDQALDLALVLSMEHNPGDLARAADLVEPIANGTSPDLQPWLPIARLLAGAIAEQRRLEEQLATQAAHNRETQHTIQQLTEKLEALKAIERSMTARVAPSPANEAAAAPPARTP
jgi:hypothetical protein